MPADTRANSTRYLDTPDAASRFLSGIKGAREIAVDTEGASYHRFVDRIYLLQLSTRQKTAIIDPLAAGSLEPLGTLLQDPSVEVVFHDADYDLRLLHQDYGWHASNIFDTRIAAQLAGVRAFGLAALLERYFGTKLDKKFQRADWSMRPLSQGMLEYAVQDTLHLLDLRDRLRDELERLGRTGWAAEEFARLQGTQWDADPDDLAWMRTKGARDLTRRELAVFRELVRWRDEVARALDKATFRVVGNEALFAAARATPRSVADLAAVKGMPRGMVDRRGDELLAAVERGLSVPDAQLPKFPRAARWERDAQFEDRVAALKRVRDAAAQRLDLDPGVLCSRDRMEAVARRNPKSMEELHEVKELRRWQIDVLGDEFLRALRGVGARS
ncbi:MAG TPA: HRDC domain-containing protein [Gemmatimonadaceae bacterium]|nr:HRDC domain-containing protein [Gemmatimonadaceae bacterium]